MSKTTGIILGAIVALFVVIGITLITFSNTEIGIRNRFEGTEKKQVSFYEQMHKTISQKVQISKKVDESFKENVNIIMAGREDSEQVMMKWITESNPNANFSEVSALYQDLSRTIEGKRMEFFTIETQLADIEREHKDYVMTFPNSFYFSILGKEKLEYAPIQSDVTKEVFETGMDNNEKLDL